MFSRVHHIAIICSDYEKSKQFYIKILGFEVVRETYRQERKSYKLDLRMGDICDIELFSFPHPPRRVTSPEACGLRHMAFEVDDIESVAVKLRDKNVTLEPVRTDEFTGKRFTFFRDPDDLPIEIYER
ncbi:MAG TPA: VOC family protein [Terriglobales bacterium]|jgi:glyoxylase I family protein|nr:VOC family protein [Terriglobales bacterium]